MSNSNQDLKTKKVWLVTGSSRGLGRALAEAVLAAGDLLIATARKIEQLDALRTQYGDQVLPIALDVTQPRDAAEVIKTGIAKFGHIDVLVNNAGFGNIGSIEETSLEEFHEQIETNLFGVINLTKAVLPYMREQRSGHIINLSSIGGRIGSTGRAPYSAAKFGIEGFSEVLANEMRPLNVKVTIIEPGGFRTDFAGASTTIHEVRPEYDPTVGKAARFQKEYDGHQPGDPKKAAQAILAIAGMAEPPLRLLLGSDALRLVLAADERKTLSDKQWSELSESTDF